MSDGLTDKQQAFVEHYLTCWNAAEAARRAGYAEKNARFIGAENLTKLNISAKIQARLVEMKMGADEVLARLSDQSRASVTPFLVTNEQGTPTGFNLGPDRPTHLVKKVSITDKGISFEVYDAQAALALMAKHHGLLVERHEHTWHATLKQQGYDPDAIKQQLVTAAIAALSISDRRDDERGDSGGATVDSTDE